MLSSYRALLAREQARPLALACALGWCAFGGYSLALILLIHSTTGSFALAGASVAAFACGSGAGAPFRGRLIDRRGGHWLTVFAFGHSLSATLLIVASVSHASAVPILIAAAITGLLVPPLIATARAEWTRVAGEDAARAHALTGALGDFGQLGGPALVGGLAAWFSATVAFGTVAVMASLAAMIVAVLSRPGDDRSRRAAVSDHHGEPTRSVSVDNGETTGAVDLGNAPNCSESHAGHRPLLSPGMQTLVLGDVGFGLAFGALEVAIPALCAEHGAASLAAVPLSLAAVGSVAASLWSGSGRSGSGPGHRYIAGAVISAAVLATLIVIRSVGGVTCVMIGAGVGGGLLNVALFELLDLVVPAERAVEAFTWLTSGQAAGIACGSVLAGQLTQRGAGAALVVASAAAVTSAALTVVRRRTLLAPSDLARR